MQDYIENKVDEFNEIYTYKMDETKKLFFRCLIANLTIAYFIKHLNKIWDKVDNTLMLKAIDEVKKKIGVEKKEVVNPNATFKEVYEINDEEKFNEAIKRYKENIERYYKDKKEVRDRDYVDTDTYVSEIVSDYDKAQETIPYFNKNGTIKCWVTIATYLTLLYNVNLTRSAMNESIYLGKRYGQDLGYFEAHIGCCPVCAKHSGKIYSISGRDLMYPSIEEAILDGVMHPNCKCTFKFIKLGETPRVKDYDTIKWEEYYGLDQKRKSVIRELQKSKTNYDIYKKVDMAKADKELAKIKRLKDELTSLTNELKKYG
jgi:hypothetical protein